MWDFKFLLSTTACILNSPCCEPLSSYKHGQKRVYGWCSAHSPLWCEGCPPPTRSCPGWWQQQDRHALLSPQRCCTPQPAGTRDLIIQSTLRFKIQGFSLFVTKDKFVMQTGNAAIQNHTNFQDIKKQTLPGRHQHNTTDSTRHKNHKYSHDKSALTAPIWTRSLKG